MSARPSALERPDIKLADGRTFAPVERLAQEVKLHSRTIKRKSEVTYVGGVAYADRDTVLLDLVSGPTRRTAPARRRRAGGAR